MRQAVFPPALADAVAATGFSPAVRAGELLYLTGATGGTPDGVMPSRAEDQARAALGKVVAILEAAGTTEQAVVEVTSYHIDIDAHFDTVQRMMEEVFTKPLPAWTAVEVAKLRRPGALVEFRIIAHLPADAP